MTLWRGYSQTFTHLLMPKILLLEHNKQKDISLKEGLLLYGYELMTTSQTEKFLGLAANASPDLLLIDMDTPGINGWQLVQQLRALVC